MKARHWGPALTSGMMILAAFFAALQLLVVFHAGRREARAAQPSSAASAPGAPRDARAPYRAAPRPAGERPTVKPPGEPHPPLRNFRQNDFAPRASRKVTT